MKLWGGRFTKTTDEYTDQFHSSISFDKKLYKYDIMGSIAHCKMLGKQGIILKEESEIIVNALLDILNDIESGKVEFSLKAEDIHMNIESILIERIGDVGKKLHTGRSRNDQVALDTRMYVKDEIMEINSRIICLVDVLVKISKEHTETIMPGYTHLQKAQPITLAHHLLAYVEMFKRDISRLEDCYKRVDYMPLGASALASTTYPLDRNYVAEELNFENVTLNSLDSVSDRDFIIELLSDLSIVMMHLSRFCEEIILWSSFEFKFIELDDSFSTGSSIMPQKKNPDMAELIRGKTGRVYGDLMSILTVMKSLPLAYNKDMQEDKECLFDAVETVKVCISVFTSMIDTTKFLKDNMYNSTKGGFTNATDAADYLVKKGVAFRDAHEIIGKLVFYCVEKSVNIDDLTLEEFKKISNYFDDDIYSFITLEECVNNRKVIGGPSSEYITELININQKYILDKKGE